MLLVSRLNLLATYSKVEMFDDRFVSGLNIIISVLLIFKESLFSLTHSTVSFRSLLIFLFNRSNEFSKICVARKLMNRTVLNSKMEIINEQNK